MGLSKHCCSAEAKEESLVKNLPGSQTMGPGWARFAPKRRRSPEFVNPYGISIPFCRGNIWETMAFFLGGTTFLDKAISFRPSNTGDLARRDHITFYCHQVRQLRATIPCVIFARLWFDSAAVLPHSLWQSTSHEWNTRRQPLENLKLENWKTGQPLKNGKQRKTGKPLDTTGNQRWKPPWKPSWLGLQETWPLREEKEVTDATEAIICCVADWCWNLQNGGGIHNSHLRNISKLH